MAGEKITYLVTNYNNAKYVGECIESIKNQTNHNWECLIVDDCSTDNSIHVINGCVNECEKIKLILNKNNIGQIQSLINMLKIVETDIVGVVDSDDAIHESTTEYILNAYATTSKIGMVYTNCIEYDENLKRPVSIGQAERLPFGPTSSIVFGYMSSLRTYRKSSYLKTEGYDLNLLYAEDLDLAYKLEEVCLPYFVNKCLYKYRYIATSRSRDESRKIELLVNHKNAKLYALQRRKISGLLKFFCYLFIYAEYNASLSKRNGFKLRKKIYRTVCIFCKNLIKHIAFPVIKI